MLGVSNNYIAGISIEIRELSSAAKLGMELDLSPIAMKGVFISDTAGVLSC